MLRTLSLIALVLYFAVLLFAVSREKKNTSIVDYFFAGQQLPFWALSLTFIASWWGAGSALSTADLAFEDGISAFWYYGVPVLIATFLMILMARHIRKVDFLTQGRMMKIRYSPFCAKLLALMVLLFMTFSAASQMVGIGQFFGTYLGLNYEFAVLFGTVIVLIYSMFGGFRGVVLTDIIQFVLLTIATVSVFIVALVSCGGWGAIHAAAVAAKKPSYFHFWSEGPKYLMYVITFGCSWMIQANVWQRITAARNTTDARKMTIMSFFAYIPLYLIAVLTGMAGFALYKTLPEGGIVTAIVIDHTPPILGAMIFIGISAAIMSTMDSLINTGAMTLVMDLFPQRKEDSQKQLRQSQIATLIITLVALLISLRIRSILIICQIASDIITTGIFIPLCAAFFWRRGTNSGAVASILCGAVYSIYNFCIYLGAPFPAYWKPQSAAQIIIGVCLSAVLFVSVSLCTPPEYDKADKFLNQNKK
ncbi:MAG: sodium:solute symporter family protein [Lentisphaeria bacterium]